MFGAGSHSATGQVNFWCDLCIIFTKAKNEHTLPEILCNEPLVSRHVSAVFTTSILITGY